METTDGAKLVNGSLVPENAAMVQPLTSKETGNIENGIDVFLENGLMEGPEITQEMTVTQVEEEISSVVAHVGDVRAKKCSRQKGEVGKKVSSVIGRRQRNNLSQSLTFPPKGVLTSVFGKGASDVKSRKVESTSLRSNGSQTLTGKVSSTQSKLSSTMKTRESSGAKIGESFGLYVKTPEVNRNPKSSKDHAPLKSDVDALSTTFELVGAVALRKSTGSVFAFRLDERAEKRKQFFMKFEEKIHAIEVEKTNQEEKSKEDQESEIKQLRKSLKFKATPMPSFYKEPAPPKVELKKIPTTRPKSPKLGRRKVSATAAASGDSEDATSEGGLRAGFGPGVKASATPSTGVSIKHPTRKSLVKTSTLKTIAPKLEAPLDAKEKELNPDIKSPKAEGDTVELGNNVFEEHRPESTAVPGNQEDVQNEPANYTITIESPEMNETHAENVPVDG